MKKSKPGPIKEERWILSHQKKKLHGILEWVFGWTLKSQVKICNSHLIMELPKRRGSEHDVWGNWLQNSFFEPIHC